MPSHTSRRALEVCGCVHLELPLIAFTCYIPVAVCCGVFQCFAVFCSVLQCALACFISVAVLYSVLECIAVYCNVLQFALTCSISVVNASSKVSDSRGYTPYEVESFMTTHSHRQPVCVS